MPGRPTRLTRRREFVAAAKAGRKAGRPGLGLQALPQPGGGLRCGFTATKKIGNAVVRNRCKRRLREAARLLLADGQQTQVPTGWDIVLIARDATPNRPWDKLLGDLRGALRQAGVTPAPDTAA